MASFDGCDGTNLPSPSKSLTCLILAVRRKFDNSVDFNTIVDMFSSVELTLKRIRWQEETFLETPNIVFVFMLLKAIIKSRPELTGGTVMITLMQCLYMSYAYAGHEISYPLMPFIRSFDRDEFYRGCVDIALRHSKEMIKINQSTDFFQLNLRDLMSKEL